MRGLSRSRSLREIFDRNEGRLIHKCDHYFEIYERHFARFRGRAPRILEIGVFHGGSLEMWRTYFGRGTHVVGVDIEPRCATLAGRGIDIRIGDQGDAAFLRRVAEEDGPFDIVIEDGSHLPEHQILAFAELWPSVNDGGVLLVEDLCTNYWPEYGGRRGGEGMFMEFVKPLVDEINGFNSRTDDFEPTDFTRTCTGMHVYDSVVVFDRGDHRPLNTSMTGRPSFGTVDELEPHHVAAIEAMNRPMRRVRRAMRSPVRTAEKVANRLRRTALGVLRRRGSSPS
ncbi:MAG: class I SAM-dependent methyltransferase [Ilumatobacter sp.]|nr:class I SAM-dependent methyltransferase [Ilumatobacter sp.]